jgi:L-2,4-diaminobutyric acid acetyltransferase
LKSNSKGQHITCRIPDLKDSAAIYNLVDRCKPLDLNSRYCYMLVCTHFSRTSIVAVEREQLVGLASGYIIPERQETLFVWQVAVDASVRGRGVALEMLESLLTRPHLRRIVKIETTISSSNRPSQNLFKRLAASLGTEISEQPWLGRKLFGNEAHEDEHLFRIGPVQRRL